MFSLVFSRFVGPGGNKKGPDALPRAFLRSRVLRGFIESDFLELSRLLSRFLGLLSSFLGFIGFSQAFSIFTICLELCGPGREIPKAKKAPKVLKRRALQT